MEILFQNSCVHTKYKSQTLLVLIMLSWTFHKSVTCFTWLHPDDVTIILHTLLYRSANSTSVQCIASSRGTTCAGPVVFTIDIAVVRSFTNFTSSGVCSGPSGGTLKMCVMVQENVPFLWLYYNRQSYVTGSGNTSASYLSWQHIFWSTKNFMKMIHSWAVLKEHFETNWAEL